MAEETSPWRGRRVLVTGCTGFLGGAVARELFAVGAEVVGLGHERAGSDIFGPGQGGRVHFLHGRADNVFRLHSAMAVHEVAAVFHLSAADPFGEDGGTAAVLQAAKMYSRRIPVVTARPLRQLAVAYTDEPLADGLRVARFGELFGPGDRKLFRTVPATAIGLLTGDRLALPAYGPVCDFVFVRDAARACLRVAEDFARRGSGDYPFRSGWAMSEQQMALAVRDVFGNSPVVLPETAPTNPLGWEPAQPFAEAVAETLAWYREFLRTGFATPIRAAA